MLNQRDIDCVFAKGGRDRSPMLRAYKVEKLGRDSQTIGVDPCLPMSLVLFDVSGGFDEETWIDDLPRTVIAKRLSGAQVTCRHGRAAGRISTQYSLALQPRGAPNHYVADGPIRFMQLTLTDALIDRVADGLKVGAVASGQLRDDLVFPGDDRLEALADEYVRSAVAGETLLELEAGGILLIGHLLRTHHGFGGPGRGIARGGLAPFQLQRTTEAIEAGLDRDLSLGELAAVAQCSPTHLSRAFKQSTGVALFTWLLNRRIERAKAMLLQRSLPLAGIALAVGFAAQPQFTTAFRRVTGVTPGAWRRNHLE